MSGQLDNPAIYHVLQQFVKEYANSPQDARTKFADAINSYDKDFDLAVFISHCDLDALEKSILALGFKTSPKGVLRSKGRRSVAD